MARLEDLVVWQKAVEFSTDVYAVTKTFPTDERFGLTSQMRRAAVSIPSNIAEGYGRFLPGDFVRFLRTASGSLYELRTQLIIAGKIGMLTPPDRHALHERTLELERLIGALIASLEKRP